MVGEGPARLDRRLGQAGWASSGEREKEAIVEWIRRFTGEKEVERNKGMEKIKRQGRLACGPLAHRGVMHY
jgi:hypothetical protein